MHVLWIKVSIYLYPPKKLNAVNVFMPSNSIDSVQGLIRSNSSRGAMSNVVGAASFKQVVLKNKFGVQPP